MALKAYSLDFDHVIGSWFVTCKATYSFALKNVVPLIQKLDVQRKIQNKKFYTRLGEDICNGCIMPPLTLSFVEEGFSEDHDLKKIEKFINENIKKCFVLDGIQRLNTLKGISENSNFKPDSPIFFNVLICPSHDKLLYRMITLNNGQKPMTARHQIEVLLANEFVFEDDSINILSEKEAIGAKARGSFKKVNFINAYLAFLSDTTDVDNKKIIEEKLDELLATKVIEAGAGATGIEFRSIISLIAKNSENKKNQKWFQNENNLIGFSVSMRGSFKKIIALSPDDFEECIDNLEKSFSNLNQNKINVGNYRRKYVKAYFENLHIINENQMVDAEVAVFLSNKIV